MDIGAYIDPENVLNATAIYRQNNDIFLQFINEMIIEDHNNTKASMTLQEIYVLFSSWHKEAFPAYKLPIRNELRDDLIRKWGPMSGNKWMGYRMRTRRDDENDNKIVVIREDDFVNDGNYEINIKDGDDENKDISDEDDETGGLCGVTNSKKTIFKVDKKPEVIDDDCKIEDEDCNSGKKKLLIKKK